MACIRGVRLPGVDRVSLNRPNGTPVAAPAIEYDPLLLNTMHRAPTAGIQPFAARMVRKNSAIRLTGYRDGRPISAGRPFPHKL